MKIYLQIVKNRPFVYAVGKDEEMADDIKSFMADAERFAKTKYKQRPDRCEDNVDFYGEDGSVIHVLSLSKEMVARNS